MKINKITIIDSKSEKIWINLWAEIAENGDLLLSGQDLGETVEEIFGDSDYEYSVTVKSEYKDAVLLHLLKERFEKSSDFSQWLKEKEIPSEFWSF